MLDINFIISFFFKHNIKKLFTFTCNSSLKPILISFTLQHIKEFCENIQIYLLKNKKANSLLHNLFHTQNILITLYNFYSVNRKKKKLILCFKIYILIKHILSSHSVSYSRYFNLFAPRFLVINQPYSKQNLSNFL